MIRLMQRSVRRFFVPLSALSCSIFISCEQDLPTERGRGPIESSAKPTSGNPVVTSTDPTSAPQDTTLNVTVSGSDFDRGSRVDLVLDGVPTDKVQTNSTTFLNSKKLIANISIAVDAVPDRYDVLVTTSKDKRGIGIELFEVTLRQGKTNLYTVTFGGDLQGSISGVPLDYRDPLKQVSTNAVSFIPVSSSGDRSACPRTKEGPVTATDWGEYSTAQWLGGMDLARRGDGSFHFQLVGDQQDINGGHINLVVNDKPLSDRVDVVTGIAVAEFQDARALVGLLSWAETDASGDPVPDARDRCIDFTITATPFATIPQ